MVWSKNVINLQMCVKYYHRRRSGMAAKVLQSVKPRKPRREENTSVWVKSPRRRLQTQRHREWCASFKISSLEKKEGRMGQKAVCLLSDHQRAATCATSEVQNIHLRGEWCSEGMISLMATFIQLLFNDSFKESSTDRYQKYLPYTFEFSFK